jgi:hypothetical protein
MGIFSSKTKQGPEADVITTPETGYSFISPYMEDYSRRLLASYFGSPGEYEGLISRARDIPIEQTAGLTPLQIQARQAAGGLGEFKPYIEDAGRLYGRQEDALDQAMGFVPQAQAGIEEGMGFQREGSDLARGAGRFSDAAERMIGTGADTVAGGIGALQRAEQSAMGATKMFDPSSSSAFYNPYEDQVVQQTLEDINRQSAKQDIGLRDRAVSAGAFGGSRGRITQEELARQTGRGAAEAVGALRSQGFGRAQDAARQSFESQQGRQAGLGQMQASLGGQQAAIGGQQAALGSQMAGLGQQQVQRGQALGGFGSSLMQGGQQLGGLGQLASGMGQQFGQIGQGIAGLGQKGQGMLGNQINMLNQLGQQGQATQQAALSRQFQGAQQLANEPMQRLQQGQALLAGSPMGGISGGTGTNAYQRGSYQEPSSASKAAGAIGTIGTLIGMFSDSELKTNITKVTNIEPNIGWYTWDWNDKAKELGINNPTIGVLAQEVKKYMPEAVIEDENGYYRVNYGVL